MACSVARVIEGNDPTIATNTTARSVAPNQITASGTHATNGVICSATTIGLIARRANPLSASPSPSAVPEATATTKEKASRIRVLAAASGSVPSRIPSRNADQTTDGAGIPAESVTAATIAQIASNPATPASGGPSSSTSHLARDTRIHLPHQEGVDLGHDPCDQHVVQIAWTRSVDPELLQQAAGRRRHHEHAIGEERRLTDVVRDEQERLPAPRLHPRPLHLTLQQFARLRVEGAERLVAQQDVGVGGERAGERHALPHACRELVGLRVGPALQMHVREPSLGDVAAFGCRHADQFQPELNVAPHRQPWEQRGLLEEHGPVGSRAGDPMTVEQRLPAGRLDQPGQHVQQRRLPAAARAAQTDELSGGDLEAEAVGRGDGLARCGSTRDHEVPESELRLRRSGREVGEGADRVGHQRRRNFSAISTCTTLPSCTTSTTVPNWILRRMSATLARTSFSSSVRASSESWSSAVDFDASTITRMLRGHSRGVFEILGPCTSISGSSSPPPSWASRSGSRGWAEGRS